VYLLKYDDGEANVSLCEKDEHYEANVSLCEKDEHYIYCTEEILRIPKP